MTSFTNPHRLLTLPALLIAACATGPQTGASESAEPPAVTSNADTSPTAAHPASPDTSASPESPTAAHPAPSETPASPESPTAAHPASPGSPASTDTPTVENPAPATIDPDDYIPGQMNLEIELGINADATCGTGRRTLRTPCISTPGSSIGVTTDYMIGETPARDTGRISCRLITPETWCVSAELTTHAGDTTTFDWSCQSVDSPVRFGEDPSTGKGAIDIQVTRVILPPQ